MIRFLPILPFFLFTIALAIPDLNSINPPVVVYIDGLTSWSGCSVANSLGANLTIHDFNTINLAFWLSSSGATDAALAWQLIDTYIPKSCGFGDTNVTIQKTLVQNLHQAGINILVSAFGSTDTPSGTDANLTCSSLASFVLDNNLDGVDVSYEDSNSFSIGGNAEQWLINCTIVLRSMLPQGKFILTHAPQAPYFTTTNLYPNGAYLTVDQAVGNTIDWYNIQYYNQGPQNYVSYQDLFIASTSFPGTAVFELNTTSTYGIAVIKPATKNDAGSGFVNGSELEQWIEQAQATRGWCGGAGLWQLKSDTNETFAASLLNATLNMSQNCASLQEKLLYSFPLPIPMPETEINS